MYITPIEAYSLNVLNSTKNKTPGHIRKQQWLIAATVLVRVLALAAVE